MPPAWFRLLIGVFLVVVLLGVCEAGPASCRDAQEALVIAMAAARDGSDEARHRVGVAHRWLDERC